MFTIDECGQQILRLEITLTNESHDTMPLRFPLIHTSDHFSHSYEKLVFNHFQVNQLFVYVCLHGIKTP